MIIYGQRYKTFDRQKGYLSVNIIGSEKAGMENCDAVKIFYSLPLDFSLSNKFTTFARGQMVE